MAQPERAAEIKTTLLVEIVKHPDLGEISAREIGAHRLRRGRKTMEEPKIAKSTDSEALLHLRAHRVLLARRINEIALRMVDLTTELETLDEEMKAKAHELVEVDRGIRAVDVELAGRHDG